MNRQQKIWKAVTTFLYASGPWFLYAVLPSCTMLLGQILRHIVNTRAFIFESGNFYLFAGSLLALYVLIRRSKSRKTTLMEESTFFLEGADKNLAVRCILFGCFFSIVISAILTLVPFPSWLIGSYSSSTEKIFVRTDFILSLLVIGITSPLLEEIAFRGYMINRLMTFFSEKQAIVISALVFGLVHVQPVWILYATGLGLILAIIAVKKDNILYSVCLHMGFNFPSLINAVILRAGLGDGFFFQNRMLIALYGVISGGFLYLLYRQFKTEELL